jgi:hypothetical protein
VNQLEAALDKVDRTADEGVRDMLTYAHARTTMPGDAPENLISRAQVCSVEGDESTSAVVHSDSLPINICHRDAVTHLDNEPFTRPLPGLCVGLTFWAAACGATAPPHNDRPVAGSCTACVGLVRESSMIVANLGDSGFRVISAGQCVFGSEVRHNYCRCATECCTLCTRRDIRESKPARDVAS